MHMYIKQLETTMAYSLGYKHPWLNSRCYSMAIYSFQQHHYSNTRLFLLLFHNLPEQKNWHDYGGTFLHTRGYQFLLL